MSNVGQPSGTTGRRKGASNADALRSSSNQELLAEIEKLLSGSCGKIDVDAVEARLAILQERTPVMETYDPQDGWRQLQEEHPAFLKWIGDTAQMYRNPSGLMELLPDGPSEYHSMREALDAGGRGRAAFPAWTPKDYALQKGTVRLTDEIDRRNACCILERGRPAFQALAGGGGTWFGAAEKEPEEEYVYNDVTYYITSNFEPVKAGWTQGAYSCEISGYVTSFSAVA